MINIDRIGIKNAVTLTQKASLAKQLPDFDFTLLESYDAKTAHTIQIISKKLNNRNHAKLEKNC